MYIPPFMRRALFVCVLLAGLAAGRGSAQLAPPGTGGVPALASALRQLGANKRVLFIAAHPDDESTQLLTYLSRGLGAQVAYLSLSRGDGGQNLIGAELGPDLGIIRSEELLAARAVDGARQFFTRAFDFGFSKSADETFRFWPRDTVLADVLDVIRRFQPQIIVSQFAGTPADGHGQHQVAGLLARQAFDRLHDSAGGPVKFYRSSRFDSATTTITLPGGGLDPLTGHSYYQIAMASRSRHRSQDMGALQTPGPNPIRLGYIAGPPDGAGALFAAVDTVLRGRERYVALLDSARARLSPWDPGAILPFLVRALREPGPADAEQRTILEGAIAIAAGVVVDAVADDGILTPGQRLQIEVTAWNAGAADARLDAVELRAPGDWRVEPLNAATSAVAPGTMVTRRFAVHVAADAPRTQPYFRRRPLLRNGYYDWTGVPAAWRGLPFEPPPIVARVRLTVAGAPVTVEREVVHRSRDQAIGEVRRPLVVTQAFDVTLSPQDALFRLGETTVPGRFTATVTNRTRGPASARVIVTPPGGWSAAPAESLSFAKEDEERSFSFDLMPPPGIRAGTYRVTAAVIGADGSRSTGAARVLDYPHIRPRAVAVPATVTVTAASFALPPLTRLGYVRGASDVVPEKLAALGVPVELLAADSLARGDLSRYTAIVIGSRAYETDAALMANNGRLLDYARAGGLVIVQYQQYQFVTGGFAPFPLSIARPHDRVTDETAPMTPLVPDHPAFHYPNEIREQDWDGWVQERGLYFPRDWDSTYVALLETADPGSPPVRGGLLVAPLGRGTYVYTGLSFFRQLPAGVPGAYRLFLNLLALGRRDAP
jgi:LmbE family N-acetylglucosaminyl deacetylase